MRFFLQNVASRKYALLEKRPPKVSIDAGRKKGTEKVRSSATAKEKGGGGVIRMQGVEFAYFVGWVGERGVGGWFVGGQFVCLTPPRPHMPPILALKH